MLRMSGRRVWAWIAAGLVVAGALPASADARRTIYRGQIQCSDRGDARPLVGAEVRLYTQGADPFPIHHLDDTAYTNRAGRFRLQAIAQEGPHFITVALRDRQNVRLKTWLGINDWAVSRPVPRNDRAARDVGAWLLEVPDRSHPCAIWQVARDEYAEYRQLMGAPPPSGGGLLVQNDAIGAGVPWTAHVEIYWAENHPISAFPWTGTTVRHEFGHVVRHGHDGDSTHFFGDIIEHGYARHHDYCSPTGLGFAFNEGWAHYWAGTITADPCPGVAENDYTVEGHVARALADLERRCFGGDRRRMVEVLERNRGRIHSFEEFRARAGCASGPLTVVDAVNASVPAIVPPEQEAQGTRRDARLVDAQLAGLRAELRQATRRLRTPPACRPGACRAALRRVLAPFELRMKAEQLRLVRRTLAQIDTAREQQALRGRDLRSLASWLEQREEELGRGVARIAVRRLGQALRASRRLVRIDGSRQARRLRASLLRRRAAARRLQRGQAAGTTALDLALPAEGRIRRVPARSFGPLPRPPRPIAVPAPAPPPAPPAPEQPAPQPPAPVKAQLSLTCPAQGPQGTKTVSGRLTPTRPGKVRLEFGHGQHPQPLSREATLDANGEFKVDFDFAIGGTWTVVARWAGDSATLAAQASCEVHVT